MRTKIAPRLQHIAKNWPPLPNGRRDPGDQGDEIRAELRALLAVARAARWWVEADMRFEKGTPAGKLHAAMCRLDRASGRASGAKGGGR